MLEFYLRVLFLVKVYLDKAKDMKERNMLSKNINCVKGNLFLLKSCGFSVYVFLLAVLALKQFLDIKYNKSLRFRKS